MCPRSLSPNPPFPPLHLLPSLSQQKALTAGTWTEGEDPVLPQQASVSLSRLDSGVEESEQAAVANPSLHSTFSSALPLPNEVW